MIPDNFPLNFLSYTGGFEVLAHIDNGFLILIVSFTIILYSLRLSKSLSVNYQFYQLYLVSQAHIKIIRSQNNIGNKYWVYFDIRSQTWSSSIVILKSLYSDSNLLNNP